MSKPAKQVLVAELTAALIPLLTPAPLLLPKSIAHAVDELAESMLRWQTRQQRPLGSRRPEGLAADELVRLLDARLHEEEDALAQPLASSAEPALASSSSSSFAEALIPLQKQKRPRLGKQ